MAVSNASRRRMLSALPRLLYRRAESDKIFIALRLTGLTIAVAVSAGVFVYLDAIGQSALTQALDGHRPQELNIAIRARLDSVSTESHQSLVNTVESSRTGTLARFIDPPIKAAKSETLLFEQDLVPWRNARTFLAHVDDFERVARLTSGSWPSPLTVDGTTQAVISADDALYLGSGIGDVVRLSSPSSERVQLEVIIVGVYEPRDFEDAQWFAIREGLGANSQVFRFAPLLVNDSVLLDAVASRMPDTDLRYYWLFQTHAERIHSNDAEAILRDLSQQTNLLRQELDGFQRITSLDDAIEAYVSSSEISRGLMLSVGAVIAVASLAFAALVAGQARDLRFAESGMMRARGATPLQELTLMTGETIIIAVFSMGLGIVLALIGVAFAGRLPGLHDLTGGQDLPVALSTESLVAALSASTFGLFALIFPSLPRRTAPTEEFVTRMSRPPNRNVLQRYYLDVVLLCVGGAALWQLSQEDLYISSSAFGEGFSNRLALAMPAATATGGAIVLLRFLPTLLGGVAEALTRMPSQIRVSPSIPLALWSLARNPRSSMGLMVLIMLAASIGVILSILSPSIERHAVDDARYRVGADVRLSNLILRNRAQLQRALDHFDANYGFQSLSTVARAAGTVAGPTGNQPITVIGTDTTSFADSVWWRDDLADIQPGEMMQLVESQESDGYLIPSSASWLTAYVKPDAVRVDTGLVARIRDESGIYHSLSIGNLTPRSTVLNPPWQCEEAVWDEENERFEDPDWCRIAIPLQSVRDYAVGENLWLEFVGVSRRPIEEQPAPTNGSVRIKDISYADADGKLTLVTDFRETVNTRTLGAGYGELGARIDPFSEVPEDGAVLTWSAPRFGQLKGVRIGVSDDTINAVGSRWFKDELSLSELDTIQLFLGNRSTRVRFVAFTDYFPTFPSGASPFLITDIQEVQRILSVDQTRRTDATNELWIAAPDIQGSDLANINNVLESVGISARLIQHARSEIVLTSSDALTAAGWSGYLIFGFIAVTVVSVLAFITTAWTTYRMRRLELAVLKSLGLSLRQLLTMIGLEQLIIAVIAFAIGSTVGSVLSSALLPYLAGKDADALAPPMVVEVGTQTLAILLGVVASALVSAVIWIFLWVRSQHASTVIRAGSAGV